jgi:hypothetical protein
MNESLMKVKTSTTYQFLQTDEGVVIPAELYIGLFSLEAGLIQVTLCALYSTLPF